MMSCVIVGIICFVAGSFCGIFATALAVTARSDDD